MKIGNANHKIENETLNSFLVNYRDTPHIATGIFPAAMLFRDGYKSKLPRSKATAEAVRSARNKDIDRKSKN